MADLEKKIPSTFSKCFYSIIIWVLFIFTGLPFFLFIFTVRSISSKLASFLDDHISTPLVTMSSFFAPQESDKRAYLVGCFGLEGKVEMEEVRSTFKSRVILKKDSNGQLQYPELQQYIVHKFGFPFWKWEKSFNLQNHIRLLQVPISGQSALSPQDVLDMIEQDLLHKPFPPNQSPWELLVVPNFLDTPKYGSEVDGTCTGTLLMFHYDHVIGDGSAVAKLFEEFFNGVKKAPSPPCVVASLSSRYLGKFKSFLVGPYEIFTQENLGAKYYWNPDTTKKSLRYNAATSPTIPVELIKKIRKATNASFSAILMASVGSALRKYMKKAGYDVPETICSTLPRRLDGHPLTKLTNHVTVVQVELPTRVGPTQLGRIQASLDAYTKSNVPQMAVWGTKLFGCLWTPVQQRVLRSMSGHGEMGFSNANFYDDEQRFMEKNKLRSIFWRTTVPLGGNGIFLTCIGFKEGVQIVFQIDESVVSKDQLHAKVFIHYFLEELNAMSKSV